MQIQMTGHNVEITDALRSITEKKMARLDHYKENITSIHIIFNTDKANHSVEGLIAVRGSSIHAKAEADEMYKALDLLTDKLVRQLNKYKEKTKDHRD